MITNVSVDVVTKAHARFFKELDQLAVVKRLGASECQMLEEMSDAAFGFLFCERSNGNHEMDSGSTFWMRIVVDIVLELVGECSLMELWRGGQVIC